MEGAREKAVVRDALVSAGKPLTVRELAELTGLDERSAGHAAGALAEDGLAVVGQRDLHFERGASLARGSVATFAAPDD
jgi:chromosome segregation and condensation protein ScpB